MSEFTEADFEWMFADEHGEGDSPPHEVALRHALNPSLPSLQESRFCVLIFKGLSPTDAYIQAFEKSGNEITRDGFNKAAKRLLQRPRVANKLAEMRIKAQAFEEESLSGIIGELNEAKEIAKVLGKPESMISAIKTKANLLGLDRTSADTNNVLVVLSDAQQAQMLELLRDKHSDPNNGGDIIDASFEDIG